MGRSFARNIFLLLFYSGACIKQTKDHPKSYIVCFFLPQIFFTVYLAQKNSHKYLSMLRHFEHMAWFLLNLSEAKTREVLEFGKLLGRQQLRIPLPPSP